MPALGLVVSVIPAETEWGRPVAPSDGLLLELEQPVDSATSKPTIPIVVDIGEKRFIRGMWEPQPWCTGACEERVLRSRGGGGPQHPFAGAGASPAGCYWRLPADSRKESGRAARSPNYLWVRELLGELPQRRMSVVFPYAASAHGSARLN